jgi:hypothetical protein
MREHIRSPYLRDLVTCPDEIGRPWSVGPSLSPASAEISPNRQILSDSVKWNVRMTPQAIDTIGLLSLA